MQRVTIIAEAGVNHNGDIAMAKKLIDVAADAGVDYIKFQTFVAVDSISSKASKAEYQAKNTGHTQETQLEMVQKLELTPAAHEELITYCNAKGVKFASTAFDFKSIELLDKFKLDFFKIPSGEITNLPYLQKVASLALPVIMSTGMATLNEVQAAFDVLCAGGVQKESITLLHCNTEYPTPMPDVNLKAMQTMADEFGVQVGYSDHTLGIEVPIAAVAMGAVCIEKHFTLDRDMEGPDHAASLEPDELCAMVAAIRNIELAMGDGIKKPSASEQKNIPIARKSIFTNRDLPSGYLLTADDLIMKRPGDGISPMQIDLVVGKTTSKALLKETKISIEDLI
jgi:N,N'-diacetyllegionaminate synthase